MYGTPQRGARASPAEFNGAGRRAPEGRQSVARGVQRPAGVAPRRGAGASPAEFNGPQESRPGGTPERSPRSSTARGDAPRRGAGIQALGTSIDEPGVLLPQRVVGYPLPPQRASSMVFGLPENVASHPVAGPRTHRERRIPFLPGERLKTHLLMNPFRGDMLDLPHDIGGSMHGVQTHQEVDVVLDTTYRKRNRLQSAEHAAHERVEVVPPWGRDKGPTSPGCKDDMVIQVDEGAG